MHEAQHLQRIMALLGWNEFAIKLQFQVEGEIMGSDQLGVLPTKKKKKGIWRIQQREIIPKTTSEVQPIFFRKNDVVI